MAENTAQAEQIPIEVASRPFAELRSSGLLWLINRAVLHPRGFALALHYSDPGGVGEAIGWTLVGDGSEPWRFADDAESSAREDECFAAVETLFQEASGG